MAPGISTLTYLLTYLLTYIWRVNMKAVTRYQIILLGEQRHIGVSNLPRVVA